ncbi:hypothetical protein [Pseudoduganella buxea]|uniref:Uncharacterized protein n=1 Tax=Pseudoduganella buxea TaxID=1949069 RepID=A0A6I3T0I1_9BURK|nr:hypothetical protein [Pseudoduganella buxea]MTV54923.1 hypothetical protein [Pseudoduganella buxea]GGC23806.1 hypothetical protein GCM10011572_51640 [Pseudoduganella buxea]
MRGGLLVGAILAVLYVGDAIYPQWSYECGTTEIVPGIRTAPATPEDVQNHQRVANPERPPGCTLAAHNKLRNLYDWATDANQHSRR